MHLATEVEEAPLSIEGFGAQKVSNDCKNKAFDFLAYNSQIGRISSEVPNLCTVSFLSFDDISIPSM